MTLMTASQQQPTKEEAEEEAGEEEEGRIQCQEEELREEEVSTESFLHSHTWQLCGKFRIVFILAELSYTVL